MVGLLIQKQLLESADQGMREYAIMQTTDRSTLYFARKVQDAFWFLIDAGFSLVEALPTLVRYRKGDVEVDIYHGRQSYEIGGGISLAGTRYAMSEIIRTVAPEIAKGYRSAVATTPEGGAACLEQLASLMQHYGHGALSGEQQFFALLGQQRKQWAEGYALDVLAAQLRLQAADAFRRGDYELAAEVYGRIRERLSPAETQKLQLAEKRRKC